MTDDEIDAAIRAVVPAECFVPNAGARAIFRAGMLQAAEILREIAVEAVDVAGPAAVMHAADIITLQATE